VDVATGWVSCAGLRDKRAQTVLAALHRLHEGLPFKIRGLDSDSGSEFLNTALISNCADQHITFTRGCRTERTTAASWSGKIGQSFVVWSATNPASARAGGAGARP
jgi:hypothetical protein